MFDPNEFAEDEEDYLVPGAGNEQQPTGVMAQMLALAMPSPAEMADLLGTGAPSFHQIMDAQQVAGPELVEGPTDLASGRAPYDKEAVKKDLKMFLSQKAQERRAASEMYQKQAFESKEEPDPAFADQAVGGMPSGGGSGY